MDEPGDQLVAANDWITFYHYTLFDADEKA
jgi:hypothetical protein